MKQCEAVSPKGTRCKLEEGHYDYLIHMGDGAAMTEAWEDDAGRAASADSRVLELRRMADVCWADGDKRASTDLHDQATRLRGKIRNEILSAPPEPPGARPGKETKP